MHTAYAEHAQSTCTASQSIHTAYTQHAQSMRRTHTKHAQIQSTHKAYTGTEHALNCFIVDFMVTMTQNDSSPELVAMMERGPGASATMDELVEFLIQNLDGADAAKVAASRKAGEMASKYAKEHIKKDTSGSRRATNHAVMTALCFFKRYNDFIEALRTDSLVGEVEYYWGRTEFQCRGALHVHLLIWLRDSVPLLQRAATVDAELARPDASTLSDAELMCVCLIRHRQRQVMIHSCRRGRCDDVVGVECSNGFPFSKTDEPCLHDDKIHISHVRRYPKEDEWVAETIWEWLMFTQEHVHVMVLTHSGSTSYVTKYASKKSHEITLKTCNRNDSEVGHTQRFANRWCQC